MTMKLFTDEAAQLTSADIDYIHQHTPDEPITSAEESSGGETDSTSHRAAGKRQGKDTSKKKSNGVRSRKAASPSKDGDSDSNADLPATASAGPVENEHALADEEQAAAQPSLASDGDGKGMKRRRRRVAHVWPELGTELTATHFGSAYTAEIVGAHKKLKSGKQILLTNGLAKGSICDSLSEAMLKATEAQRDQQKLGRKSASNGWDFWTWDGKTS